MLQLFNPEIKGGPQVSLSINSLVLRGGEGSSNLGFPTPIEDIGGICDLIRRMNKTASPQATSTRNRHRGSSPIDYLAETPSEDEIGSPNGQLGTQAPPASDLLGEYSKATKTPAPPPRALKPAHLPGNQLLGLIGKNKRPNTSSKNLGGMPLPPCSNSLSDNKRMAAIEDGAGESKERKIIRLTGGGKDDIRMPVSEHKVSSSGKPIQSRRGALAEDPQVDCQGTNRHGSNIGTPPVDPLRITASRSEKEQPKPVEYTGVDSRLTNTSTFNSFEENPWRKLTRIPLKHIIIPKNQLVKLSTGASWVTSVADIESLHTSLPSGSSDRFLPFTVKPTEYATQNCNDALGRTVEDRQNNTNKLSLNEGSLKGVGMSSPRKSSYENQPTASLSHKVPRDTTFQNERPIVLDAAREEDDDAVSWAATSRASSVGPRPGNGERSNTHSPQTKSRVRTPRSSVSSPSSKLNMDSIVRLSAVLPSLPGSLGTKSNNRASLGKESEPFANNVVHSSIPQSEDDMEQRVPYAVGDIIQSSDDIHLSCIPAPAPTVSPTTSQQSPVLQIERTPYSRSQKDQPSLSETSFLGSPLEPKKSIPSPHSSVASIILGTFNWDVGKNDDTPGNSSIHGELQQSYDKDHLANDVTIKSSAKIVAERSERLSTPVLDHPPKSITTNGEKGELSGESPISENESKVRHSSRQKSTPHKDPSVDIDTEKLLESAKLLGSIPQVCNVLPSLPSITSPTSRKVAKSYITRRERKKQRNKLGMQFP